jgi:hypothetical protein
MLKVLPANGRMDTQIKSPKLREKVSSLANLTGGTGGGARWGRPKCLRVSVTECSVLPLRGERAKTKKVYQVRYLWAV